MAEKDLQDQLMKDPAVQAAMQKAGQDALNNPEVQNMMKERAKAMFTADNAKMVGDKMQTWASDPAVQEKAKQAGAAAMAAAGQAGMQLMKQIEQGPAGIRVLAFAGGCASIVIAVMYLINPLNAFAVAYYVISGYQLIFAATTILFEAPQNVIEKIGPIDKYQAMLIENCKFISLTGGRGLFYIFQGSLWLALMEGISEIHKLVVGLYMIFIGFLHVAMHYGKLATVVDKMKEGANRATQYQQVATQP